MRRPLYGARHLPQRDLNLLPTVIANFDQPASQMLKPILNALWNSCGLQQYFNYNKAGDWAPERWD
jgi:hypothetical protein